MNALEIKDLTKHYPDFSLDRLSLTLPGGCVLGLIGENGAGKTTTIRLILDMIHRDGGSITILGKDNRENLPLTKQDIGVVFDEVGIPGCLNALQVGKIMALTYKNWDSRGYQDFLKRFSLPEKKRFQDYSRGMKMKLGLAVALSHKARLLLLDEATSGLDPVARDQVVDILLDFARQGDNAVLISSHIVSDLEKICDSIAFVHKGRLLFCEEKDKLMEEYALLKLSKADFEAVPPEAVVSLRENPYGVEVLVRRELVNEALTPERATLEEIILFFVKGADAR